MYVRTYVYIFKEAEMVHLPIDFLEFRVLIIVNIYMNTFWKISTLRNEKIPKIFSALRRNVDIIFIMIIMKNVYQAWFCLE